VEIELSRHLHFWRSIAAHRPAAVIVCRSPRSGFKVAMSASAAMTAVAGCYSRRPDGFGRGVASSGGLLRSRPANSII